MDSRCAVHELAHRSPTLCTVGLTRFRLPTAVEIEVSLGQPNVRATCNPLVRDGYPWFLLACAVKNRLSFLQVESNERCSCSEKPPWISGPSSLAMACWINSLTGRFLSFGVSLISRMISPPSSHRLSRCRFRVLRESP